MISRIALLSGIVVLAACRDATEPAVTRRLPLAADVVVAAGTERRITTSGHASGPAISGDRIVWQDDRNVNPEFYIVDIFMFDLATGTERQITDGGGAYLTPAISGGRVVWASLAAIYMFDLATGTELQMGVSPRDPRFPAISGDRIVWEVGQDGPDFVRMFDLASATEGTITTGGFPGISGDRIVWLDSRNSVGFAPTLDIYMLDLASGTERRITTASTAAFGSPAISGDRIVWRDNRNGNADIYMFDLASGTERRITTASTASTAFLDDPAISGDRIVWTDVRNGNGDIYMFDLSAAPLAITPPGPITVLNDQGTCDAAVNLGTPTITGGAPPVNLGSSPPPPYIVGTTTVTWTGTDAAGNTASATQDVIVRDVEVPTVTSPPPADISTDPGKATASFNPGTATATDNCLGVTVVGKRSDAQALNAPYPIGRTLITWTATDASGNKTSAEQPVTVRDLERPALTVPADFAVDATSPTGAVVTYTASASDNVALASLTCSPASGTAFPIATTTVTCVAMDPSGNAASKSFHVTVRSAQAQLSNADNTVTGLGLPSGTATSLTTKLDAALAAANAGDIATACATLQDFINETQAQAGKKISTADAASLIAAAQRIRAVLGC